MKFLQNRLGQADSQSRLMGNDQVIENIVEQGHEQQLLSNNEQHEKIFENSNIQQPNLS